MQDSPSKLTKFWRLPMADKWLFIRAVFWLGIARTRLAVSPFQRLVTGLAAAPGERRSEPDLDYIERVGFAVRAAAAQVPWRSDCFPQAIAAYSMIKARRYAMTIHLGVEKKGDSEIAGHAWLTCGGLVVTGGEDLDRYTEMHHINA